MNKILLMSLLIMGIMITKVEAMNIWHKEGGEIAGRFNNGQKWANVSLWLGDKKIFLNQHSTLDINDLEFIARTMVSSQREALIKEARTPLSGEYTIYTDNKTYAYNPWK